MIGRKNVAKSSRETLENAKTTSTNPLPLRRRFQDRGYALHEIFESKSRNGGN